MKENIYHVVLYVLTVFLTYLLFMIFDMLPKEISELLSLISFSCSLLISVRYAKIINNPIITIILFLYTWACIEEINSQMYQYSDKSFRLWQVGNWLVIIGFLYEVDKLCGYGTIFKNRIFGLIDKVKTILIK